MHVLVAYGSKMGGTRGLAEMIAGELEGYGLSVDTKPARKVRDATPYDAIILGGALYGLRWHKDARRFARRHRRALEQRPVWLFSSGPLDDSALRADIPPVRFVRNLMRQSHARGHVTFGGRLAADAKGFPAASMAKKNAGDWRDADHVRDWAKRLAEDLRTG